MFGFLLSQLSLVKERTQEFSELSKQASLYQAVEQNIDKLEAELKRINRWSESAPSARTFENMGPFGMNTMTPETWLQFVFIPRIRDIIKTKDAFPDGSGLGAWAVRNMDMDIQKDLLALIHNFIDLIKQKS